MRGVLGVAVLAALALPQDAPKTPPVFGASIENVYIDAFVTRSGAPVTGLTAADFELRDNGVIQTIELATAEARPLLAVLAFDVSGSLDPVKLQALKSASDALLKSLRPEDRVSLLTFSDEIEWRVAQDVDKTQIRRALDSLKPGGGTPVMDALFAAITLPESEGRTLVVLFTDGFDNLSFLGWRDLRAVAERSNALIYVVTLAPPVVSGGPRDMPLGFRIPAPSEAVLEFEDSYALRQVAEVTGGRLMVAASREDLGAAFGAIAESMGRRYILRYAPEGAPRPGWHRISLKVRGGKGDAHTRSGYWVPESRESESPR